MKTPSAGNGISIGLVVVIIALLWAQTNGFQSQPVASSNVTVQGSGPTVNDDVDRGYLPGHVWVDDTAPAVYIAITTGDGAADWNQVD